MSNVPKYDQSHWDEFHSLVSAGSSKAGALRALGIPIGSLGSLQDRFNGGLVLNKKAPAAPPPSNNVSSPAPTGEIGELETLLHTATEDLLDLATRMSELSNHARGLRLLDKTLVELEAKSREATALRRSLADAEGQLLARAMVVHSDD